MEMGTPQPTNTVRYPPPHPLHTGSRQLPGPEAPSGGLGQALACRHHLGSTLPASPGVVQDPQNPQCGEGGTQMDPAPGDPCLGRKGYGVRWFESLPSASHLTLWLGAQVGLRPPPQSARNARCLWSLPDASACHHASCSVPGPGHNPALGLGAGGYLWVWEEGPRTPGLVSRQRP